MFNIDGVDYNMLCSVTRTATIRPSEVSGYMLDKHYYNDVLGTYMTYDVSIAVPVGEESNYALLYEQLTDPYAEHTIVLPYNQSTTVLKGRIQQVSDRYVGEESRDGTSVKVWRQTRFSIISNYPIKAT